MVPVWTCLAALSVLLYAEFSRNFPLKVAAKLVAASAFVWAGLYWGAFDSEYGRFVLAGLVLCLLGDALLLPEGSGPFFLAGLSAFLCGHIAYSMAFLQLELQAHTALVAAGCALVVAVLVLRWLWPRLAGPMQIAVPVYVAVIMAMVVLAWAAYAAGAPLLLALGATGFALSDLAVARERFVILTFANRAWGLPAYFISQLLIAASVQSG